MNSQKGISLTAIIFIIAVFATGVFFGRQILVEKPEGENTETGDWRTYKDESMGWEVEYPKDWVRFEDRFEGTVFSSDSSLEFGQAFMGLMGTMAPDKIGDKTRGEFTLKDIAQSAGCMSTGCQEMLSIEPILSKNNRDGYLVKYHYVRPSGEEYDRYTATFFQGIDPTWTLEGFKIETISVNFAFMDADLMNQLLDKIIILERPSQGPKG